MGIPSFFSKKSSHTISTDHTQTTCKLTTKCSEYISEPDSTDECNNELVSKLEDHIKHHRITRTCAITDRTFYLEVLIDRNTYIYFEDEFKETTVDKLKQSILNALSDDIENVNIRLSRADELEDGEVMFKFGANVRHTDSDEKLIEIFKKTSMGHDSIPLAIACIGEKSLVIDRFILEKALEPIAASTISDMHIALKTEFNDSLPIVTTPDNWSFEWKDNELIFKFTDAGVEESLHFLVKMYEENIPDSYKETKEPYVINNADINCAQENKNTADTEEVFFDDDILPVSQIASDVVDEPKVNFEDEQILPLTHCVQSPKLIFQLEYVVCGGDYLKKYGLNKLASSKGLREQKCTHNGLLELGISNLAEPTDSACILFDENGELHFGRKNPATASLSRYLAFKTSGESDSIAHYGFSRSHALLTKYENKVTLTSLASTIKLPTYILDEDKVTKLSSEETEIEIGNSILAGCFIFKLIRKSM